MTAEESKPNLDYLNAHAVRYEFTYRHRWLPGDILIWDNRPALHYAVRDYDLNQMRRMIRCSLVSPDSGSAYAEDQESSGQVTPALTAAE
jgi:taurine dioxygenase